MAKAKPTKKDPFLDSPEAFHLQMPLYRHFDLSDKTVAEKIYEWMSSKSTIDAYCVWCGKSSVFSVEERLDYTSTLQMSGFGKWMLTQGFTRSSYCCTRSKNHKYYSYYYKVNTFFTKIGQWPSSADFQIPEAEKYRKILSSNQYTEFTKGIGLAAHGVGIGSYVYLRRVFEDLIEEAHSLAKKDNHDFDEETYSKSRMDEKIGILKEYIPEFLVENKKLYSILSIGIHSLKEDDCLTFFETVKIGIEQILDEKIQKKERTEKAKKAREAIQQVHRKITKID